MTAEFQLVLACFVGTFVATPRTQRIMASLRAAIQRSGKTVEQVAQAQQNLDPAQCHRQIQCRDGANPGLYRLAEADDVFEEFLQIELTRRGYIVLRPDAFGAGVELIARLAVHFGRDRMAKAELRDERKEQSA